MRHKTIFSEQKGFSKCYRAIEGTHIAQTYVNRKGYHSIILQCVCREDMRFINCFAGWNAMAVVEIHSTTTKESCPSDYSALT